MWFLWRCISSLWPNLRACTFRCEDMRIFTKTDTLLTLDKANHRTSWLTFVSEIRVFSLPCRMQTHTEHVVTRLLLDTSKMAMVWWKCTRIRGSLSWTCCIPFAQNFAASIKQRTTCASRVTASKVNESSWTCDSLKLSLSHTSVFYLWKEQLPLLVVVQTKTTKCARIWIALQTNSKGLHMRIQNAVKGPTHV